MKPLALLLSISLVAPTFALEDALPRGEDVVEVPAVGDGLCVHNLFQSNMVLQRDKPVRIWGYAKPGESVEVSFSGKRSSATAEDDRSWSVSLPPLPANADGQTIAVKSGSESLALENVLIGDVWILGGQSNMEFPMNKVEHGQLEIATANYDGIRILTLPKTKGPDLRNDFARLDEWSSWSNRHFRKGDWDVCSPEIVHELSAIGYVFARRIHTGSKIPIGVIDASIGGTTVETWTPRSVLDAIGTAEVKAKLAEWDEKVATFDPEADLTERIKKNERWIADRKKNDQPIPDDRKTPPSDLLPGPLHDQNRPGNCYNNILGPIIGLEVKGAIFHQGFNNALGGGSDGIAMYRQIFPEMIKAWRAAFNDPSLPFGILSLCTAGEMQTPENYVEMMANEGIYIRAAQYETFVDLRAAGDGNVGFASTFDLRREWYHPQVKIPAGERIAGWAMATLYGQEKRVRWLPPTVNETVHEGDKIVLRFDSQVHAPERGPILGFAIAGEDRRFQPASADYLETGKDDRGRPRLDRRALVLTSPHVPEPIHFRYAWGRNPMGNLKAEENSQIPFATQRSDSWKIEEIPLSVASEELNVRQIRQKLKLDDLERRLAEAKALLEEHGSEE